MFAGNQPANTTGNGSSDYTRQQVNQSCSDINRTKLRIPQQTVRITPWHAKQEAL
jgi:hypothetical protein